MVEASIIEILRALGAYGIYISDGRMEDVEALVEGIIRNGCVVKVLIPTRIQRIPLEMRIRTDRTMQILMFQMDPGYSRLSVVWHRFLMSF
ncbi:MAG: hypothetical protein EAX81_00865 [Candidatus Thorarchaeota archaeon]|nr:hypothetical protein [Candidatus Thorarchaeota archaeon]